MTREPGLGITTTSITRVLGSIRRSFRRVTFVPTSGLAVSAWAGYLMAHDRLETPIGMQRYGASILTENEIGGGRWSSAAIWGVNIHHHGSREHNHDPTATNLKFYHVSASALLETTVAVTKRSELYARLEQVSKSGDELGFQGGDLTQLFTIRSLSLAATRDFFSLGPAAIGLGVRGSLNLLPETLRLTYGHDDDGILGVCASEVICYWLLVASCWLLVNRQQ
jgi:hypothetical protein